MPRRPEFLCAYVDHHTVPVAELSALLQSLERHKTRSAPDTANLATCQRFEVYSFTDIFPFPAALFGSLSPNAKLIAGRQNVCARLAYIASGSESCLLGERFIPQQVERSFRHLTPGSALATVAAEAVAISVDARDRFKFSAAQDYGDIAFELLGSDTLSTDPVPPVLLVVGSGMLGRALADHPSTKRYDRVFAVSRWPKQLRSKLSSVHPKCIHPESVHDNIGGAPFDMAVAVSNVTPEYVDYLTVLAFLPSCRAIVDLSTSPILAHKRPSYYLHEYDPSFSAFLQQLSAPLLPLVGPVQHAIDESISARMELTPHVE